MRVAFTSDVYWPRINGVTVSTNIFINELTKLGHSIKLWAPEYPTKQDPQHRYSEDPQIVRLKSWGMFFAKEDRYVSPLQRWHVFKTLDDFRPELIHIQTEFSTSFMAKAYARKRDLPVVMTCHTYFEQYINYYMPFLPEKMARSWSRHFTHKNFNSANTIIAPTEPMRQILLGYDITCPIHVIPTGIQEEDFKDVAKEREQKESIWFERHPRLKGRKVLLYVGRVGQEKNVDFLLDVVQGLQKDVPKATLVLAGNGPYLEDFQKEIVDRGLEDVVICLGYVDRKEIKHLYALADVFTFASKTETQGLVTIEAMMCHTPSVAIGLMGTKEVMNGDHGGFMVEDNVDVFTERVRQLLTDTKLYRAKSEEAYAYSQNWTAAKMAAKVSDLYKEVVTDFKPRQEISSGK